MFFKLNHTWIHFDTKFIVTWQLNKFLVKKNWYEINFKQKTNFKLREQKNKNTKICIDVVRAIDRMSALSVLGHETHHSRMKITDTNRCTPMVHHLKHCWFSVLYMQSTESELTTVPCTSTFTCVCVLHEFICVFVSLTLEVYAITLLMMLDAYFFVYFYLKTLVKITVILF